MQAWKNFLIRLIGIAGRWWRLHYEQREID